MGKRLAVGIWVGWRGRGEFRRGEAAAAGGGRRRPGSCTGGRAGEAEEQRTEGVQRKKKRGNKSEGLVWNF
jgi:hypothetical protein